MLRLLPLILTLIFTGSFSQAETSAPPLTLAKVYKGEVDLTQYWVSEKLDGVRAYWDGQQFISRQGHPYSAPNWFTKGFPKQKLDGELWLGRGQFQSLVSVVRKKQPIDSEWQQVWYFVFDLPQVSKPFSQRLSQMRQLISQSDNPYLKLVKQYRIANQGELQLELERIETMGGEGLMLHRADALYHVGRNNDVLKVKPYSDAEAIVISHMVGKGKYTGMMGSLLVEMPNGLQFKIGSGFTDLQRANPPKIGSIVTYTYHGKTKKGIPKFASFLRIRKSEINLD